MREEERGKGTEGMGLERTWDMGREGKGTGKPPYAPPLNVRENLKYMRHCEV